MVGFDERLDIIEASLVNLMTQQWKLLKILYFFIIKNEIQVEKYF